MIKKILAAFLVLSILGGISFFLAVAHVRKSLPKLITVSDYKPLLVSQIYDRNNKKIGEYSHERRILVPYNQIPKHVVNAFLAAEDDKFFEHHGVNYLAILRATLANLRAGKSVQGGSTITQQTAKTLLLSPEKTLLRKLREAMLAQMMEENLKKEEILYLYLNQIYFGQGSYGVGMAAETYFRKTVDKLTLAEAAILAGLPQAPSRYSPVSNPLRAKERQLYVLKRMGEVGFVKKEEAKAAMTEPVKVYMRENYQEFAPYFLETVRQMLVEKLGEDKVLDEGLRIYTSLDLEKQLAAQDSVMAGLKSLDKRQGFRGATQHFDGAKEVGEFLLKSRNKLIASVSPERIIQPDGKFADYGSLDFEKYKSPNLPPYLKIGQTVDGVVSKVDDELGLTWVRVGEIEGLIDIDTMTWAKKPNPEVASWVNQIKKPSQALKVGDRVLVKIVDTKFNSERLRKLSAKPDKKSKKKEAAPIVVPDLKKYFAFELDQEPDAEASLISFDQDTQDVLAMIGGKNFEKSEFNRALQAARQTGSSFKAFVYASALDRGYTPSSPIMDAPLVYQEKIKNTKNDANDSEEQDEIKTWKPENHGKTFGGDIIFRNALVKSLNVPSVKIIEDIGVNWATEYARRLGIFSPLNQDFTLVLGSSSVTLFEMTRAFSTFGRLGKRPHPVLVRKVTDSHGKELLVNVTLDERYDKETKEYNDKFEERRAAYLESLKTGDPNAPRDPKKIDQYIFFDDPDQVIRPQTAYVMTSLLKGVVEDREGTGGRAKSLGREVAGKTGTTNGYYDAWFVGYTPQIATGVWVGFDREKTLGKGEVGGRAALPIWVDYMKAAHQSLPVMTFPVPPGIVTVNIDRESGQLASAATKDVLRQAFIEGTEPTSTKSKSEENTDFYKQDLQE